MSQIKGLQEPSSEMFSNDGVHYGWRGKYKFFHGVKAAFVGALKGELRSILVIFIIW
jgi:hypothetical protein